MNLSRNSQRRSPGAEPGPPPTVPTRSMSPAMGVGTNRSVAPRLSASRQIQPAAAGGSGSRSDSTRRTNVSSRISGFSFFPWPTAGGRSALFDADPDSTAGFMHHHI